MRLSLAALFLLLVACRQETGTLPATSPSAASHTPVATAALQPGDVPPGLVECPGSGPISVYLATLQTSNPRLATLMTNDWLQLRSEGARNAAVTAYSADSAACADELGATAASKGVASYVVVFGDEGQADRAWQAGILGFAPPAPGEQPPGLARGAATGLGDNSWTYIKPPIRLASWRRSVFVALVLVTNLDANVLRSATGAVDARLN